MSNSQVPGPAGEITKRRDPFAPTVSGTATASTSLAVAPMAPPVVAPVVPPEKPPMPGREDQRRQKGGGRRTFMRRDIAWRQSAVYVASVTATSEVGLMSPPVSGPLLTRVSLRIRTTVPLHAADYWTVTTYWRNETEGFPIAEVVYDSLAMTANLPLIVMTDDAGIRIEANHEVTVVLTKSGSAPALSGLMLYADWYVKP